MATLTQAVEVGDSELHINTPLSAGQVPGFVQIDDELLNVGGQDNLAGTTLVLAMPAQAAHDSGATVTYAGRPYDPTFKAALGGAGGEQTIRLADPGTGWQASHAYADGDRFRETVDGKVRVFEITTAGTSGGGAFADYMWTGLMIPGIATGTGTEEFVYLGVVGEMAWATDLQGFSPLLDFDDADAHLKVTNPQPPSESVQLFAFRATVDGSPLSVFEMKTDGDGDYFLDHDAGASLRFTATAEGVAVPDANDRTTHIGTTQFYTGSFEVEFDPPAVYIRGLPTANPNVAGQLWSDSGTLKVSAG
jgi:hypothetical protein